jgi:hypothetical protein
VFGVIVLFLGVAIAPSINANINKKAMKKFQILNIQIYMI